MDVNLILGIFGSVLGIAGLVFAYYTYQKGKRDKRLVYEILPSVPIAEVFPRDEGYGLSIVFEKDNAPPQRLSSAIIHFIRFSNLGDVPILKEDIARDDPLSIEISGRGVLDISLVSVSRDVSKIELANISIGGNKATCNVGFEFLDKDDGGLLQVVSRESNLSFKFKGTIVGMPKGLTKADVIGRPSGISGWGCLPIMLAQLTGLGISSYFFYRAIGSWDNILILFLPLVALLLPALIALLAIIAMDRRVPFSFAEALSPPRWYQRNLSIYDFYARRRQGRIYEESNDTS